LLGVCAGGFPARAQLFDVSEEKIDPANAAELLSDEAIASACLNCGIKRRIMVENVLDLKTGKALTLFAFCAALEFHENAAVESLPPETYSTSWSTGRLKTLSDPEQPSPARRLRRQIPDRQRSLPASRFSACASARVEPKKARETSRWRDQAPPRPATASRRIQAAPPPKAPRSKSSNCSTPRWKQTSSGPTTFA